MIKVPLPVGNNPGTNELLKGRERLLDRDILTAVAAPESWRGFLPAGQLWTQQPSTDFLIFSPPSIVPDSVDTARNRCLRSLKKDPLGRFENEKSSDHISQRDRFLMGT
jgi:hypothetical protein